MGTRSDTLPQLMCNPAESFLSFWKKKNEEWFMFHCLDVSRHLSKLRWATGWIFWLLSSFFFFLPTSASTSPSAIFFFSLRANLNKYHPWEGARASLAMFCFYWKLLVTLTSPPPSQPLFSRCLLTMLQSTAAHISVIDLLHIVPCLNGISIQTSTLFFSFFLFL